MLEKGGICCRNLPQGVGTWLAIHSNGIHILLVSDTFDLKLWHYYSFILVYQYNFNAHNVEYDGAEHTSTVVAKSHFQYIILVTIHIQTCYN